MKLNESVLAQIGRQTLLAGVTFATSSIVEQLNDLRSQLGMPPVFSIETSDGSGEPGKRRGRPPGSVNKRIAGVDGTGNPESAMSERRALVKEAGLKIHGSPSEADAAEARKILAARGATRTGETTAAATPAGTTTILKRRWALIRAADMKVKGSPDERLAQKALTYLTRKGIPLPPEATMPLNHEPPRPTGRHLTTEQKDNLRSVTAYRWRAIREAGLVHLCRPGRLPSNEVLAKAEKILKARQEESRQGCGSE